MTNKFRAFVAGLGLSAFCLVSAPAAAQLVRFPDLGIKNPTHTLYKDSGGVVSCYGRASNCKVEIDRPKVFQNVSGIAGLPIGF